MKPFAAAVPQAAPETLESRVEFSEQETIWKKNHDLEDLWPHTEASAPMPPCHRVAEASGRHRSGRTRRVPVWANGHRLQS